MKPKETIKSKVLNYFQKTGHNLDNAKALAMFGYFRLPVAVQSLRKEGHLIKTETYKGPGGNTLSFYTYKGSLTKGVRVVVTGGCGWTGAEGEVQYLDEGDVKVKLKGLDWPLWFSQNELDILQ